MSSCSSRSRIFVIGDAAFSCSCLGGRLLNQCHDVICLDNSCAGSKDNITESLGRLHFELMRHDLTFPLPNDGSIVPNFVVQSLPRNQSP